jgi:membrane associated rhomboid family serine protease
MFFPIKDYNPTKKPAIITILFIIINIFVFAYQNYSIPDETDIRFNGKLPPLRYNILSYALIPIEITHLKKYEPAIAKDIYGRVYRVKRVTPILLTIIISMFMHGSFMHLFGNMVFLWIFGNNIEDYLGVFKFIIFYFLVGIFASLTHIIFNWNSTIPVIGASGAVSGVMGAYLILYPNAKVKTLVFILIFITFIDIPASVFLIIWFIFQFFYKSGDGVAFLAHIGGFITGLILIFYWRNSKKRKSKNIEFIQ